MEESVILVDAADREIGTAEKIQTHRAGRLHRAFSIFVFNAEGQLLLQRRARTKYHSAGLWSNTCCGHPRPGEATDEAAHRRLREEMGFDCDLVALFSFTYHAKLDNDLTEYEFDHVFLGLFDGEPTPNPDEVDAWTWVDTEELRREILEECERYTHWLGISIDRVLRHHENRFLVSDRRRP